MEGSLSSFAGRHALPDLRPHARSLRGVARARAALAEQRSASSRAWSAQHATSQRRRLERGPRATRAAACSRPAARSTTRSRPATCRCSWRATARSALTTLPAVLRDRPDAKVLWLDAHGDYNTPETTPSEFLGGMCLAAARAAFGTRASAEPSTRERVVLAGVRDLDPAERELLEREPRDRGRARASRRSSRSQNALDGAPVYVHLDLDVIDPEDFPAQFPAPGGLRADKLYDLLEAVLAECEIVGAEITAFEAPADELERRPRCRPRARPRAAGRRGPIERKPCPQLSPSRSRACCGRSSRTCTSAARRRGSAAARRRSRSQHAAGQADRARAPRAADRRGHVHRARHPRAAALLAARDGGQRGARRRRHHRLRQGRRPPGRRLRLRLHRHGRLDGHDRRAQGRAPARAGADQAHAVHLAARLRRRAHPGGGRLAVRRLRPPVPRGGGR